MRKEREKYIKSCAVSEIVCVELGGFRQKILIEAQREGLPVVVFLHGGPGFPPPFCVGARGLFPEITKSFTAVYWDQLGSGINRYKIGNRLTIERFVRMTKDLVAYLKSRFPQSKLYLFGISWGSVLSAYAAAELPERLAGVYAAGQVVLPPMRSKAAAEAVALSRAPASVKRKIAAFQTVERPSKGQIALLSKTLRKYTDAYGIKNKNSAAENPMREIFASKDYKLCDKIACFRNGYVKADGLLAELSVIDLRDTLSAVRVPYHIYAGGRDLVTAADEAKALVETANNADLKVTVFEREGHVPSLETIAAIFCDIARDAML